MQRQSQSAPDDGVVPPGDGEAANAPLGLVDELFREGLGYFDTCDLKSAQRLFERAVDAHPAHARARSFLGVCVAANDRKFERALALCTSAAKQEFFNPDLYLNLARIHLVFGFKVEGRRFLLRGQMIDPANEAIRIALVELGDRSEPVLRFLPRRHIINRWLGEARHIFAVHGRAQVTA